MRAEGLDNPLGVRPVRVIEDQSLAAVTWVLFDRSLLGNLHLLKMESDNLARLSSQQIGTVGAWRIPDHT